MTGSRCGRCDVYIQVLCEGELRQCCTVWEPKTKSRFLVLYVCKTRVGAVCGCGMEFLQFYTDKATAAFDSSAVLFHHEACICGNGVGVTCAKRKVHRSKPFYEVNLAIIVCTQARHRQGTQQSNLKEPLYAVVERRRCCRSEPGRTASLRVEVLDCL